MAPPGREDSSASLRDLALQEELDVKQQINQNLKKALEIKTREAEAAKSFLLQAEALLRPFNTQGDAELPGNEEEDGSLLLRRVSQGIRDLTGALNAAQDQLQRAAEGRQQLVLEKQRLEGRLEEANGALREAQIERLRLKEAETQRDAFRIQAEAQQQSLEQQALLIDGLKQRCITLEAEKRELSNARSTTAEGSGSSFRSLFFSWGPEDGHPRQRRGVEEAGGDVLSYTLADGLEEGLRQPSPRRSCWWCCRRRRRYYTSGWGGRSRTGCIIQ